MSYVLPTSAVKTIMIDGSQSCSRGDPNKHKCHVILVKNSLEIELSKETDLQKVEIDNLVAAIAQEKILFKNCHCLFQEPVELSNDI